MIKEKRIMRSQDERDFQLDAIEVALHQIDRRMAAMERESHKTEPELPSFAEALIDSKRASLEAQGKVGLSNLLGIGGAFLFGLIGGVMEDDNASPLVSATDGTWRNIPYGHIFQACDSFHNYLIPQQNDDLIKDKNSYSLQLSNHDRRIPLHIDVNRFRRAGRRRAVPL